MLDTLSKDQRLLLRKQLDDLDANEAATLAEQEAIAASDFQEPFTTQRQYTDQALDILKQADQGRTPQSTGAPLYEDVFKAISPNQPVPEKPMSPLTKSVMSTLAPQTDPNNVQVPLVSQQGSTVKQVLPPSQTGGMSLISGVGQQGTAKISPFVKSTEVKPLEERNIEEIEKQRSQVNSERKGVATAYDIERAAEEASLSIKEKTALEEAAALQVQSQMENKFIQDRMKYVDDQVAKVDEIRKTMLPVDPNRWFNNRSTLQKIGTFITLAFDQNGTGQQFITKLIDNDIAAQEKELQSKGETAKSMLATLTPVYGSIDAAKKGLRDIYKDLTKSLSEANAAGMSAKSPIVQKKVLDAMTKRYYDRINSEVAVAKVALEAQDLGQKRRQADQENRIKEKALIAEQSKINKPDELDRKSMSKIAENARKLNQIELLEKTVDPTSSKFWLFKKAKESNAPIAAFDKKYSQYYEAVQRFVANRIREDTGQSMTEQEAMREAAMAMASMTDKKEFADYLTDQRKNYINEKLSVLSPQGKDELYKNYPETRRYFVKQRQD